MCNPLPPWFILWFTSVCCIESCSLLHAAAAMGAPPVRRPHHLLTDLIVERITAFYLRSYKAG